MSPNGVNDYSRRRKRGTQHLVPAPQTAVLGLSFIAALLIGLGSIISTARGDQGWEGHSLHLNWENDATRGSDRHYTQGARILYLAADSATPGWLQSFSEWLPSVRFEPEAAKFGIELGHEIYTPEDLENPALVPDDRPYAGWLYASGLLQRRGTGHARIPTMEQLRMDLGVIGPESKAEETQKVWHGRDPRGWHNQLDTEFGFALRYERASLFRIQSANRWTADGIPSLDASVGNVDVHLGIGAALRLGYNIPNRFEIPARRTQPGWGAYAFGRIGGRMVLRNIFLDGNTWESSHSVDKNFLVGDASVGFTVVFKRFELTASNNYRTREFDGQDRADSYGSATLSFKF